MNTFVKIHDKYFIRLQGKVYHLIEASEEQEFLFNEIYGKVYTCEKMLEVISELTQIPVDDIKSNIRKKNIVFARAMYCYCMKKFGEPETLYNIAKAINMTHASVIHHLKSIEGFVNQKGIDGDNVRVIIKYFDK